MPGQGQTQRVRQLYLALNPLLAQCLTCSGMVCNPACLHTDTFDIETNEAGMAS